VFERPRVTLHELQTVYGLEDLYDLLEVGMVTVENRALISNREAEIEAQSKGQN
jgi:hypothetical protein